MQSHDTSVSNLLQTNIRSETEKYVRLFIPIEVLYREDLEADAKLCYGEILRLCEKNIYHTKHNAEISYLYDVSESTVAAWIYSLEIIGFLKRKKVFENSSDIESHLCMKNGQKLHEPISSFSFCAWCKCQTYILKDRFHRMSSPTFDLISICGSCHIEYDYLEGLYEYEVKHASFI